ncbi:ABC transporter substrate-binding protein [uncultured Sphaerochaeta sp.]|uniref:ABC transporter substrate-binding protein n=1 Tax=uncultured Sphaerochaeta sp. TaxID=886478 RepID=UPI002A0A6E41|nr:ABC transporter substrate-binding protein [uncultured Sphaerochaeta sp.]
MSRSKFSILLVAFFLSFNLALFAQPQVEQKPVKLTYTDSLGRVVAFSENPRRIISLAPNVTETIAALGSLDLLVGRTDYCNYPVEVSNIPSIGTLYTPSVEKLISLKPDLVIASSFVSDQLIESLQKASIKIVCINKQETFSGTYAMIEDIAFLLGKEKEGKALVSTMKNTVSNVVEKTKDLPKPRVYFLIDFGSFDGTATGDTFIDQMLSLSGATNIAKSASNWTYSKELLVENDPDLIIISPRWGETAKETIEAFSSTKPYKDLRSTKEGNLVSIDADLISRQGPRSALALQTLAKAIHPGIDL